MATSTLQYSPTNLLNESKPLVKRNMLATIGFYLVCVCTLLNINYFTRQFFDTEQALSIFYLVSCLLVIAALRFPIRQSLGSPGIFWAFMLLFFLGVSTRGGLGVSSEFFTNPGSNLYRILSGQLITMSAAAGAYHLMLAGKTQSMLRIVFFMMLAAALTILLAKIFPALASKTVQGRVGGVFGDANRAGHALCYTAAFGFAALQREKSWLMRVLIQGGLVLLPPCLLITNSRSSILFMVLLVGIQAVFTPILKQKGTIVALALVGIGVPVAISIEMNQRASHVNALEAAELEQRQNRLQSFARILSGEMSDQDNGHRFLLAAHGIKHFISSPVIGVGFQKLTRMPEVNLGCHNMFIRVFGEGGIFCGLFYILGIIVIGFAGWCSPRADVRILGIGFMTMYACSGLVAHTSFTTRIGNICMGICLGLISASAILQRAEARQRRAEIWSNFSAQQRPHV